MPIVRDWRIPSNSIYRDFSTGEIRSDVIGGVPSVSDSRYANIYFQGSYGRVPVSVRDSRQPIDRRDVASNVQLPPLAQPTITQSGSGSGEEGVIVESVAWVNPIPEDLPETIADFVTTHTGGTLAESIYNDQIWATGQPELQVMSAPQNLGVGEEYIDIWDTIQMHRARKAAEEQTAISINPVINQQVQRDEEMATDWGNLLGGLAETYVNARWGGGGGQSPVYMNSPVQAQPVLAPAVGQLGAGALGALGGWLADDGGIGLPGVDIVGTGESPKGKLYNPRTGKWQRCHRRRRKLLTDGDFKCLATLKTLTGNNDAFKAAVVRAVR